MLRRGRRRTAAVAVDYATAGWPVCLGTHLREERARHSLHGALPRGRVLDPGRACSCDRIGCPAPGAHPISPAWQIEAGSDPGDAGLRWHTRGSFVVAPPSRSGRRAAQWIREPAERPLPDALRLLEFLADACEEARV